MTASGTTSDVEVVEPPARQVARSSREVLERVMLLLSRLPVRVDRGPVVAAMGGTLVVLVALDRSEIDDPDHLDLLRAAVSASERAHGAMIAAEGQFDTGLGKSLAGVFDALSRLVEPTIDLVVSRQEKLFRRKAEAPPKKPDLSVFEVCPGAPRLFTFERTPLSLSALIRVAPPPEAVREEEARETEREVDAEEEGETSALLPEGAGESRAPGDAEEISPVDEGGSLDQEVWDGWEAGGAFSPEEAELRALRRLARDAAEEIGNLGLLRTPAPSLPTTPWAIGPAAFEGRLLAHLDAFMALAEPFVATRSQGQLPASTGPQAGSGAGAQAASHGGTPMIVASGERRMDPIGPLLEWAGDAMVPDPARAFARAFVLGCVAGEDTAAAAMLFLRQSHSLTYEAQRDAIVLCPHPGVVPLAERMITEEAPPLVRTGLSILERRGAAHFETIASLLSHPKADVRAAAARCMGAATAPQAAVSLLAQHAESEEDDGVLAAAAESLLVLGSRRGLQIAREKLTEEAQFPGSLPKAARADLLRLLAIGGGGSDGDLLLSSLGHDPFAAAVLGWYGDPTLIPAMLSALAASGRNPARWGFSVAIMRSIHRITGLARERIPGVLYPLPPDPKTPVHLLEVPLDPDFWPRIWEPRKEAFSVRRKHRFGAIFTPVLPLEEAESPETPALVRRELLLELSLLSRGKSQVREHDWIARQKAALAELRAHFRSRASAAFPPGDWLGSLFE